MTILIMLQVYTEGHLMIEFVYDDLMRIKSWHFAIRSHSELIPKQTIPMQVGWRCETP